MSRRAKWEYLHAIYARYQRASRTEKSQMLDECCQVCGYHRKAALRLLNGPLPASRPRRRPRRTLRYSPQALAILLAVWEAASYPWSVRLKALLLLWLPWMRQRVRLTPVLERQVLAISARQLDRRLAAHKTRLKRRLYGRTKPGTLLKHHIPIKTDHWDVTQPGSTDKTASTMEPSRQAIMGTGMGVHQPAALQGQVDAPPCPDCGAMMIRSGSCYKCFNCGATSGCS